MLIRKNNRDSWFVFIPACILPMSHMTCKTTVIKTLSYFWALAVLFLKKWASLNNNQQSIHWKTAEQNEITAWNVTKHIYLDFKLPSAESVCGRLQKHQLWRHKFLFPTIFPSTLRLWQPKKSIFQLAISLRCNYRLLWNFGICLFGS